MGPYKRLDRCVASQECNTSIKHCISKMQQIYQALADEESRDIYQGFYHSLLTNNKKYITETVSLAVGRRIGTDLLKLLAEKKAMGKKIVIFCCGALGRRALFHLREVGVSIDAFCDNNSAYWETLVENVPVVSPERLAHWKGDVFFLIATNVPAYLLPIQEQVTALGFLKLDDWISTSVFGEMYFPDFLPLGAGEVFADCGAYNGDESFALAQKTGNAYRHIYLIEPDKHNMGLCKAKLAALERIHFIEACVMDKTGNIGFSFDGHQGSQVSLQSEHLVPCISMDDAMKELPPTYIKMDLEGAEFSALMGASNIIACYKPKLAVSIYHRPEDIFTLPALLLNLHPGYRFYLRHQSFGYIDTVLYALP